MSIRKLGTMEDGYKGLVHRPDTSKAPSLINGLQAVRQLHYRVITETGLTTADEMLYPSNLILVDDLVLLPCCWGSFSGGRTPL